MRSAENFLTNSRKAGEGIGNIGHVNLVAKLLLPLTWIGEYTDLN